jgi:hydroxyacylglutathione hydrolase
MQHVVQKPKAPFLGMNGAIEVHQVPVWQDNLVWIVVCTETGEAAVVDGPQADEVLAYVNEHELKLNAILNTHTHSDHIGINRDLAKRGLLSDFRVVGPKRAASAVPGLTEAVDEGDEVILGAVRGRVMRTEGHIDGHISFVFGDVLFCGDTLFTGGCGYLFDGPPARMYDSLMRLAALPGETRVCCAHEYTQDNLRFAWFVEPGNEALAERIRRVWAIRADGGCVVPSTLEEERATNPFLRPGSLLLRARLRQISPDVVLETFEDVFTATRALKDTAIHRKEAEDGLPLQ